jgi:hypothetical protein
MPLAFLFDEHLRGLPWRIVQRQNARQIYPIDVVCVGDAAGLPLGSDDATLLRWAEIHHRILVSRDEKTLPSHLLRHLVLGNHSPGVFLLRAAPFPAVVDFLVCAAYASEPAEWMDRVVFVP